MLYHAKCFSDMTWCGYIGQYRYFPPFTCEGGLINIKHVDSIYCKAAGQSDCRSVCPRETMEAYPSHYNKLLGFNGTAGRADLSPPRYGAWRCILNKRQPVEYIQISGSCDIGKYPCCPMSV